MLINAFVNSVTWFESRHWRSSQAFINRPRFESRDWRSSQAFINRPRFESRDWRSSQAFLKRPRFESRYRLFSLTVFNCSNPSIDKLVNLVTLLL